MNGILDGIGVHLLAILALGVLCGSWVLFQRWIAARDPSLPGIRRSCTGCTSECDDEARHP